MGKLSECEVCLQAKRACAYSAMNMYSQDISQKFFGAYSFQGQRIHQETVSPSFYPEPSPREHLDGQNFKPSQEYMEQWAYGEQPL